MKLSAPVALLDTWTGDGRMLRSPQDGTVRHRPFPLPVLGGWTEHRVRPRVGTVDALDIRDGVLVASVTVDDPGTTKLLLRGLVRLELDVDDVQDPGLIVHDDGRMEFTGWRVVALTLGTSPCWDQGPVQYWCPGVERKPSPICPGCGAQITETKHGRATLHVAGCRYVGERGPQA